MKRLILIFVAVMLFGFVIKAQPVKNGKKYRIQSALGTFLDVKGGQKASGTDVWAFAKNETESQQWIFVKNSDGYYQIISVLSGMFLDVKGGSTQSGTDIWVYESNNTDSQLWSLQNAGNGYYYIVAKVSSLNLDVWGGKTESGTKVWQFTPNQTDSQKWKFVLIP
jgi:hypothetical protein